jgi:hypothetical protein
MSLGKRHIGRRVAGVGVAVALMVLGLEAPAFAAEPTVTGFTPGSGPAECIITITGTAFTDSPKAATEVTFDDTDTATDEALAAEDFTIASATEIWAEIPTTAALTPGAEYTITVSNNGGSATSTTTFLSTTGVGTCAPTITSFLPTCGAAGTVVTITGTNLLLDVAPDAATASTLTVVSWFNYADTTPSTGNVGASTVPNTDTTTTLTRFVPTKAADGPISVETDVDSAFSASPYLVPPPDCVAAVPTSHARSISFKINKSGKTSGVVKSTEETAFTDCVAAVPVKIQKKKKGGGWKTVGTTTTNDTGAYTKKVKNKKGKQKYRALAPKVSLGDPVTDVCLKAKSATRKI